MTDTMPPFPHDLATQNDVLRRFAMKVAEYSNDEELANEAYDLVVLYGNPDAQKPQGIINVRAHPPKP